MKKNKLTREEKFLCEIGRALLKLSGSEFVTSECKQLGRQRNLWPHLLATIVFNQHSDRSDNCCSLAGAKCRPSGFGPEDQLRGQHSGWLIIIHSNRKSNHSTESRQRKESERERERDGCSHTWRAL